MDGGAGLNLLSLEVFCRMQIGECKLTPSAPFCGVTNGKTIPLGQIELPIAFGGRDNFRTVNITFDVAHFDLPYNTILGRPALAKLMAVVHYAKFIAVVHYSVVHQGRREGLDALRRGTL